MRKGPHIPTKTANDIVQRVSQETSVSIDDILGESTRAAVSEARVEVYRRLRRLGASYPEIGRLMLRNASTVSEMMRRRGTRTRAPHAVNSSPSSVFEA